MICINPNQYADRPVPVRAVLGCQVAATWDGCPKPSHLVELSFCQVLHSCSKDKMFLYPMVAEIGAGTSISEQLAFSLNREPTLPPLHISTQSRLGISFLHAPSSFKIH